VFSLWLTVYSCWLLWIKKGVWFAAIENLSRRRVAVLRFLDGSHLKVHQEWDQVYWKDLALTDEEAVHVLIRDQAGFHLRDGDPRLQ
jgi:hypothetical protein